MRKVKKLPENLILASFFKTLIKAILVPEEVLP